MSPTAPQPPPEKRPLDERAMALVLQMKPGISQSQLGKLLGINTRDISRVARRLELRHKIHRTKVLDEGRWTYDITPVKSIPELLSFSIEDLPNDQDDKSSSAELPRAWTWQQGALAKGRISVDRALNDLDSILQKLGLGNDSPAVATEAHSLLRQMVSSGFTVGRNPHGLMALSLYVACRRLNVPATLKDVCNCSLAAKKTVSAYYREMYEKGLIDVPFTDPILQLDRIIVNLRKGARWAAYVTEEAKAKAIAIIEQARKLGVVAGKDPSGLAGTALYLGCSRLIPQAEVARAASVTEVTLRNNHRALEEAGMSF